ncbi:hypothetical protein TELCIR_08264 [Teladorsagia circumcincta]|uniref:C-type lectin domain-containing protein n=1 Tax=Teladorsagia circumcincta TaxID=45464 RepID=A0A2G9UJI4_TELCI|nr:hypothetical protein TELCIR_08264 [Teladorsagia circumcincta]
MLFVCFIRLFVGLSGVVLTLAVYIDEATIAKAKNGEWIPLPNGSEEDMIKVVRTTVLGKVKFTYEQLEEFCENEDSHFASLSSKEEQEFATVAIDDDTAPYTHKY